MARDSTNSYKFKGSASVLYEEIQKRITLFLRVWS